LRSNSIDVVLKFEFAMFLAIGIIARMFRLG